MSTITLGLLLHFYQPSWQAPEVLARIVDESYRPLLRVFHARPRLRASININAVTTEMLVQHGYGDVVQGLRSLAERGQIELTGSGKFHPILPLLPPQEATRQISLNAETQVQHFGAAYRPVGFFPPEMAFAASTALQVAQSGHQWLALSGVACPTAWPLEHVHRTHAAPSLAVLFRDDILSNIVSFRNTDVPDFIDKLKALTSPHAPRYVMIAMDGETYGHHIPGWEEEFLARLYDTIGTPPARVGTRGPDASWVQPARVSDIVQRFPAGEPIAPRASSWSTTASDIHAGDPFPLWKHPGNEIQELLWRHLDHVLAQESAAQRMAPEAEETRSARHALDRAEHSDQFWWASRRPHWSPTLVQRGLNIQREALLHATRAVLRGRGSAQRKRNAEDRLSSAQSLAARVELLLARE
ncbi:MAG: hypothetical protein ACRDJE_19980 [Dehalococcoidia bacterium]